MPEKVREDIRLCKTGLPGSCELTNVSDVAPTCVFLKGSKSSLLSSEPFICTAYSHSIGDILSSRGRLHVSKE